MTDPEHARELYTRIRAAEQKQQWMKPALSYYVGSPFKALIASMLSARTKEEDTLAATQELFALASTAEAMTRLTRDQIAHAIRRVTYPESKVGYVQDIAQKVVENGGDVPDNIAALMQFKGVGWKVATLTLEVGFRIHDNITVDVHVARIGKRLGLVQPDTDDPAKINEELKHTLPMDIWPHWNWLMVQFGREVCGMKFPKCRTCPVNDLCPKIGVND